MKKLSITFAISCLIMQAPIYSRVTPDELGNINHTVTPDLFGDLNQNDSATAQPSTTSDDTVVNPTDDEDIEASGDEDEVDSDAPEDNDDSTVKIKIPNSIVAKDITPKDFLEKSNIKEIEEILKVLLKLSTEEDDNENLSANIQNLGRTLENLKYKRSLKEKNAWELSVRQMIYARTAGLNDGQSETTDVNLVKAFLEQLYKINPSYKITSAIQKRTNQYALQSMSQCSKGTLYTQIVPSYKSMVESKHLEDFKHWDKVAIDRWGNDMYSCYRGAFESAATVQVYLQLIKPELKLIKDIFSLIKEIDEEIFFSLSRIQVPTETEESFKSETDLSLTAVIEAYNSNRRGIDVFLFEHLQEFVKNQDELDEKLETIKTSLLALKSNPSVSSLLSGQTDIRNNKITIIQKTLPQISIDLSDKIKEIGQDVELSKESVFENKNGEYFLKSSFTTKIKDAKTAEEIDKLLSQVKNEKHQLIASALKNRYESAKSNGASKKEIAQYRDEMNAFLGEKYQESFSNSSDNSGSLPTSLETPITGKIFNIETSLRILNAESKQIGSIYNNDKVTIIGVRWSQDKTPIAYQIEVKKNRLKAAFKSEESGYVSADYVKLDNQEDLDKLLGASANNTNDEPTKTDSAEDASPVDANLNYSKFEASPGKIINISTSLRVLDRDGKQIASMYSNEKVMVIGIHWNESASEPLAYLIDLSSDTYKRRLKEGSKEEGYISADYCEFEDPSKLPTLKNVRDTENQAREDLIVQNKKKEEDAKQLELRETTMVKHTEVVNDMVLNLKDYLDIEDNITRNKVNPNAEFVKALKDLYSFVSNSPDQDDNEAKLKLSQAILSFFVDENIEGGPVTLNYYFMSSIIKDFQAKADNLLNQSKAYLETIK